ncbi:MAG: alginate O-acetyltransferase complex protein AlgI, partial [Gammaproteobacteria bacterium]
MVILAALLIHSAKPSGRVCGGVHDGFSPSSGPHPFMLFASGFFLYYFLPLFLALYYLSPKGQRTLVLALASYVFYGWWRPDFVFLMWISTVVDFTSGKRIERARRAAGLQAGARGTAGKPWLLLSLFVNLGLLAYFKYANFGVETMNGLLAQAGWEPVAWTTVILPVGISFYTFQTLSYTVDVYRGSAPPVRSMRDFACYVAMFPQLVAGPIVRYSTVAEQLHSRTHTLSKFYAGVLAFQAGLAKKVLLADVLSGVADEAFNAAGGALSTADAWLGSVAYTLQIYFD